MKYILLIIALVVIALCVLMLLRPSAPAAESVTPSEAAMAVTPSEAAEPVLATEETVPETEPETLPPDPLQELLSSMTLEERVGQLFLARCPEENAVRDLAAYHLGGFILFGRDFEGQTPESIRGTLSEYQQAARIPLLLAVDEEGGTVTRVSQVPAFRESRFRAPREYFNAGGLEAVLAAEEEKSALLSSLGINVNMAPVADISRSPGAFMYQRSLGQDPETTGAFVSGATEIMASFQIGSVLKHFPGYGGNADTHTGSALDRRSLQELEEADLIPFRAGIDAGCGAVLVSHNVVTAFDPHLPATLSPEVHRYLREELGFRGVIITDDLVMGAIQEHYTPGEAAVQAVLAGNDLLCCSDYPTQYEAVLAAVLDGRITIDQLNSAVLRVLKWKQDLGLISSTFN